MTEVSLQADIKTQNRQSAALAASQSRAADSASSYSTDVIDYRTRHAFSREHQNESSIARLDGRVLEFKQPVPHSKVGASWLFDALVELDEIKKLAQTKDTPKASPDFVFHTTEAILRLCEAKGVSEPVVDLRENGGIEIFCREVDRGLLIVINPDKALQIFGDFSGETWRSRYDLSGTIWQTHLLSFLRDLIPPKVMQRA
jgi:hypothetical protein